MVADSSNQAALVGTAVGSTAVGRCSEDEVGDDTEDKEDMAVDAAAASVPVAVDVDTMGTMLPSSSSCIRWKQEK